ncbi:hypothetical protein DFH07DRAFT_779506 [Mycena maculata]|uniref:Uncharacterized protein n=1 Tax=Mycena maculata TaxID=230809 RepID=A0AAD7I962_9AGAR|nr:hypothetical protein DFH07DRAFT_779506 [Mycena maculata]
MPNDGTIIPADRIPAIYASFNTMHQLIRRQDRATFVIKDPSTPLPYAESVISAKTVQTYIRHNLLVNDPDLDITYNPFSTAPSGRQGFSRIAATEDEAAWTEWHMDGDLPTLVDYLVRDVDIEEVIPPGHVVVPKARWDAANDAMWAREQGRGRAIASAKAAKAAKRDVVSDVYLPAKRARIAAKSAAVLAEYQERKRAEHAAAEAAKAASGEGGSGSGTGPSGADGSGGSMDTTQ